MGIVYKVVDFYNYFVLLGNTISDLINDWYYKIQYFIEMIRNSLSFPIRIIEWLPAPVVFCICLILSIGIIKAILGGSNS